MSGVYGNKVSGFCGESMVYRIAVTVLAFLGYAYLIACSGEKGVECICCSVDIVYCLYSCWFSVFEQLKLKSKFPFPLSHVIVAEVVLMFEEERFLGLEHAYVVNATF